MSVILFPGIKCHDVSSFTCLTCTLVFFVSIPRLTSHPSHCVRVVFVSVCLCVCGSLCLHSLSNATLAPISASAQTSTVSVYVSTQTFSFFIIIHFWLVVVSCPHPLATPRMLFVCTDHVDAFCLPCVEKNCRSHATGMICRKKKEKK